MPLPPDVHTLADHERVARARLPAASWAYLNGAAADGMTDHANQQAWQALKLWPRVLRPLDGLHTEVSVDGRSMAHPLFVAPMAYHSLAHPQGELASALAASALGAGYVISAQASTAIEDIARVFGAHPAKAVTKDRGPLWLQLFGLGDPGAERELMARAHRAGCEAIVLTVDAPVQGVRDAERRAGFVLPPGVRAVNLPERQRAWIDLLDSAWTWDDVAHLVADAPLPVWIKGITHPDDARTARDLGVAGLIVSNHGGRTLDTQSATAHSLRYIVQTLQGDLPLLVDGGIRRGTDVLKAMALGAQGVLIGRPVLHGLATAGSTGVAHVLRLLLDELQAAMALCGHRDLRTLSALLDLTPNA